MLPQRLEPREFVEAQLYTSEDEVVQEALRHLVEQRPDVRVALAVYRYGADELMTWQQRPQSRMSASSG